MGAKCKLEWNDSGRQCSRCLKFKEWSEFNKARTNFMGHQSTCRACQKEWVKENKELHANMSADWFQRNKHKVYKQRNKRYASDELFKLTEITRRRIGEGIKTMKYGRKNRKTQEALGCTFEFLKQYLEERFEPGMSWSSHSKSGWHIDHIVPLTAAKNENEFYKLCHYTNLQPLWAEDNLKKGAKIIK